ncbi:MAG TPA: hypothetical protein VHM30_14025 [Gemmatimonadaceae bacterium]|nr:hypothetical protein [Gemmatimonadaceae bacterium]
MSRRLAPLAVAVTLGATIGARVAGAQCRPPENSNEAKLLAYYAAPIVFAPQGAPGTVRPWSVALGGELTYIPRPDAELQHTGRCFTPKDETTQLSPVFPRPRVAIGLPFGVVVEASYLPPIKVAGAEANLFSGAISYSRPIVAGSASPIVASVRAHVTRGWVRGAITCAKSALQSTDSTRPCYGTSPSRDTFHPDMAGVEGSIGRAFAGGRVDLYGGGGMNWLAPRFQVGFASGTGYVDRTRVEVDLTRAVWFAGGSWRVLGPWAATAQVYGVPEDVTLVRLGFMGTVHH